MHSIDNNAYRDLIISFRLEPAIHANDMTNFDMSVDSDGNVMWLSPLVIKVMCHLNVRLFPYDSQICNLTMGSWVHHGLEIDIWNRNVNGKLKIFDLRSALDVASKVYN